VVSGSLSSGIASSIGRVASVVGLGVVGVGGLSSLPENERRPV
jgi:hypothetical protein